MIVAIITLYYPKRGNIDNVIEISKQVDKTIVCDNTPVVSEDYFKGFESIKYIANKKNMGLSRAFNIPLKDLSNDWKDNDFIIFFDQDSRIPNDYIEKIVHEYESIQMMGYSIGCLGPVYYNNSNNTIEVPRQKKKISDNAYIVNSVITSSMLCKYGILKQVDFWNQDVFLDLADWDLCWRLKAKGYYSIKTKAVILNHTLGEGDYRKGFIRIRYGASIREYYQVRDGLYLLHRRYTPFKNKIRFACGIAFRLLVHTRVLNEKEERKKYIIRGLTDYKKKVTGIYKEVAF